MLKQGKQDRLGNAWFFPHTSTVLRIASDLARRFITSPRALRIMSVGIAQPPLQANGDDPTLQDWPEAVDPFSIPLTGNAQRVHEALQAAVENLEYRVMVDGEIDSDGYVSAQSTRIINIRQEVCRACGGD